MVVAHDEPGTRTPLRRPGEPSWRQPTARGHRGAENPGSAPLACGPSLRVTGMTDQANPPHQSKPRTLQTFPTGSGVAEEVRTGAARKATTMVEGSRLASKWFKSQGLGHLRASCPRTPRVGFPRVPSRHTSRDPRCTEFDHC